MVCLFSLKLEWNFLLLGSPCNTPVNRPASKHCTSFTHLSLLLWKENKKRKVQSAPAQSHSQCSVWQQSTSQSISINEVPLRTNLSCLLFPRSMLFHSRTGSFDSFRSSLNSGRKFKQSVTAFLQQKKSLPSEKAERLQLLIITLALSPSDFVTTSKLFCPNTQGSQPSQVLQSFILIAKHRFCPNLKLLDLWIG